MPISADRLLETIGRRRATACSLLLGRPPEVIVEGEPRELQVRPLTAEDLDRLVDELLDPDDRFALGAQGHHLSSGSHRGMTFRVQTSRGAAGYAVAIHTLKFPARTPGE